MIRFSLLLFLLILLQSALFGQTPERRYGKLSQAEFDLEYYEQDSTAAAVILFDLGESCFKISSDGGLDLYFTRTTRIKILDESAIDDWSNVSIPYYVDGYNKTEKVSEIKAVSYNYENAQLTTSELEKEEIFDEQLSERWHQKKFAIPGVKKGSIIEYTYQINSPFKWNLKSWEFQSTIPALYSEYTVKMTPFYEYIMLFQGQNEGLKKESYVEKGLENSFGGVKYRDMVYTYSSSDVAAFSDDDFITSREDYIQKIEFQLAKVTQLTGASTEYVTTWQDMVDDFNKEDTFGKYINSAERYAAKNILPELNLNGLARTKKIEIITKYIKDQFRWNHYYGKYTTQRPRELISSKTGNDSDLNLFLIGMLRAAGLESNPILISTRRHGKIYTQYPITQKFNYVIAEVAVDNGVLLLDATEPLLPYYLLPTRCFNDYGFIIKDDSHEWIGLSPLATSQKLEASTFKISGNETTMSVREQLTGYDAWRARQEYLDDPDAFNASLIFEHEELNGDISVNNDDVLEAPLLINYKKIRPIDSFEGDRYLVPFNKIEYAQNPLVKLKRKYPVDLVYTKKRVYTSTIGCDENSKFKHLPESTSFDDELMTFSYNVQAFDTFVKIDATFEFKKNVYQPEEYDQLKKDFDILYKKLNEQIVVTTKK
ncbi:protein of unknown function [Reichenbachiella agariperforans]|uniref:Uncharacterized protein n=1 Tax=Reichenbachiella agariperforans TaxID=156994 RepID=A0A1M6N3G8_REIAG|nr:DUF3857 domain-containing protein [Reichenbachiella agariperforans]SHJ90188.1 protein of unknown function [Reichenbachiella agariperforans]